MTFQPSPTKASFIAALVVAPMLLAAQVDKVTYPHTAIWSKFEVTEIFQKRLGVGIDLIERRMSSMDDPAPWSRWHRTSVRPWVHYQPSGNFRISLSPIAWFGTLEYLATENDRPRQPYEELRTTLQILHHHKNLGGRLTHSFRHWIEARYREPFNDNAFSFARYRMRYRLRYVLNKKEYAEQGMMYGYASNEVMVNYGSRIVYNMFSQNRIQLAVGYRIHNSTRIELRYMNRYRSRPSGFEYDNTQALMIGLFIDQFSNIYNKDIRPIKFYD